MRRFAILGVAATFLLSGSALFAADRLVPDVYPTIQAGINAANPGDTVTIAPGTYTGGGSRDLDFGGKAITVQSTDPYDWAVVEATVIDCGGMGRGFHFHSGETGSSVLAGLTIIDGNATQGGAILCDGGSPSITHCVFNANYARYGGAIDNENSSPTITNCIFTANTAEWYGGAIENYQSSPTIRNCVFSGNSGVVGWGWGGAIDNTGSSAAITGCTFYGNSADYGGAVYNYDSSTTLSNCILWADSAPDGPEIYGDCTVSHSDVEGGFAGTGNIDADPCFADAGGEDFHLLNGSPCIDTGDPAYSPAPGETDIDSQPRQMGLNVDMGTDEFGFNKPIFEVWPSQLDFTAVAGGPNPVSQVLSIRNIGANTLNWQVTEACPWLEVAPTVGESSGDVNQVTVSVDVTGLGGGPYYCQVTVSDPCATNSPQTVDVGLTVQGPAIELSTQELDFYGEESGSNPTPQIFSISNAGAGILNWQIAEDCNWLWVTPTSGQCTTEPNQIAVIVEIDGLPAGQYNCELVVSDPCAANSPQTVDVYLGIRHDINGLVSWWQFDEGAGAIASDSFGTNHGTLNGDPCWVPGLVGTYALEFDGEGDYVAVPSDSSLNVQYVTISAWVQVSGTGPGTNNHVLNRKMTNPGTYGLWVRASDNKLGAQVRLQGSESTGRIIESDTTAGSEWTHVCATYDGDKLKLYVDTVVQDDIDDTDGTIDTDNPNVLTIGAHPTPTSYFDGSIDDVRIYNRALSAGEIQLVYLEGIDSPVIGLPAVDFGFIAPDGGPNPADQALSISNNGVGTLNWEITEGCGWLSAEPNSGSSTGETDDVTLSVDISGLTHGTYNCQLAVSDPCAMNSPQTAAVTLHIYIATGLHVPSQYATIQAAIDGAVDGDTVIVAPGTYSGGGNRDLDFGGKAITVRSIDPNDPCTVAATVIDCQGSWSESHRGFYFHTGEGPDSVVAGLTVANGFFNTFLRDLPGWGGGGICSGNGASPTISNCIIKNNKVWAIEGGWARGGGIYCAGGSAVIRNCIITGNGAWGDIGEPHGGGVYCGSGVTLHNCLIVGNEAGSSERASSGGGVYGSPTITQCTIARNSAHWYDMPGYGDGIYGSPTVSNSIIWGNIGGDEIHGSPVITYSDINDGWPGEGNLDADPCLVTGPFGGYYLSQMVAGQAVDSPCVDAGNDLAVNLGTDIYTTRTDEVPDDWIVDMGYHYPIPISSFTCWDANECAGQRFGEATCDGSVDLADLFALKAAFGSSAPWIPPVCCADFNHDDSVNLGDLFILKAGFGTSGHSPSTGNQACPP
jgi:hypothetical protein